MTRLIKMLIVALVLTGIAIPAEAQDMIKVRGSDTMVNLVQRLAEVYMEKNPGKLLSITGGGSGNGLAGLRNRTTDIANSSREIRMKEIIDMNGKGVKPVGTAIGKDCITIVVNASNPVDKLTLAQLSAIYRGDVTNWKDVGGTDKPITMYGRQSNSGTYLHFKEHAVKADYSDKMYRMNGNAQIVESIKTDTTGIGYVGLGYALTTDGLKVVKIATAEGEEYIDPTNRADVDAGKYTLIRPVYQYTHGEPTGAINDFIQFELSQEGQRIVDEMGFIPLAGDTTHSG